MIMMMMMMLKIFASAIGAIANRFDAVVNGVAGDVNDDDMDFE